MAQRQYTVADFFDPNVVINPIRRRVQPQRARFACAQTRTPSDSDNDSDDVADMSSVMSHLETLSVDQHALCPLSELKSKHSMFDVDGVTYEQDATRSIPEYTDIDEIDVNHAYTEDLPIMKIKESFLVSLTASNVVLVTGETGCGKSTYIPQFILDDCRNRNERCNIVVTQPRRIAAVSLAQRVSHLRNWQLGQYVGYQIGLKKNHSTSTLITYVTTGVLLNQMVHQKNARYTHVILDEVHERTKEMDFLLILLRNMLLKHPTSMKLVLMSATYDIQKFARYFSSVMNRAVEHMPIEAVPVGRKYRVDVFYYEQFYELFPRAWIMSPEFDISGGFVPEALYDGCANLIRYFEKIDTHALPGTVLVFLPGLHQIEQMYNVLRDPKYESSIAYDIIPLHSSITGDEQKRVFKPPTTNRRKVILSTNIAESSITIPDVQYVIDFCLTKELYYDPKTSYCTLKLKWASKQNCNQRAGRAGRTQVGRCYRLLPLPDYNELSLEEVPEMLRAPLETLVLQVKELQLLNKPAAVLSHAMDPPLRKDVLHSIVRLKLVGALLKTVDERFCLDDGDLTFFGQIMSKLPIDIRASKMIILGNLFGVLEESIIMAAGLNVRNIFSAPFKDGLKAYNSRLSWADSSCSDLIALLNVYTSWVANFRCGLFQQRNARESNYVALESQQTWARRNFVQLKLMNELHDMVREIKHRLQTIAMFKDDTDNPLNWHDHEKAVILKVVIAGAFYPNYYIRSSVEDREKSALKILNNYSPYNSVYLQASSKINYGILYVEAIKNKLKEVSNDLDVIFETGSQKVYIHFPTAISSRDVRNYERGFIPGHICTEVYRAVRYQQLFRDIVVPFLPPPRDLERLRELGVDDPDKIEMIKPLGSPVLPLLNETLIVVQMSFVIDPGHFWIQRVESAAVIDQITEDLTKPLQKAGNVQVGQLYAGVFDGYRYRCRVEEIFPATDSKKRRYRVFYIDYGNTDTVTDQDLFEIPAHIRDQPGHALECVLAQLQPNVQKNCLELWTPEAEVFFRGQVQAQQLFAQIYSVVEGVVSIILSKKTQESGQVNINELLVKRGFAQTSDESHLSKSNHELRENLYMNLAMENIDLRETTACRVTYTKQIKSPTADECGANRLHLRGPYSPLEAKLYAMKAANASITVSVSGDSVNTVLLDSDPQNSNNTLLVAACSQTNQAQNRLLLGMTTLMPSIPGIASLMCMLFCPKMEVRANKTQRKLIGALCGLGEKPDTNRSICREEDLLVNFDVEFDEEDINAINAIRYLIGLTCEIDSEESLEYLRTSQNGIKQQFINLISRRRKPLEKYTEAISPHWNWINENVDPNDLLIPDNSNTKSPYGYHGTIRLRGEDNYAMLLDEQELLIRMGRGTTPFPTNTDVVCNICGERILNQSFLRLHLRTQKHLNALKKYNIPCD